MNYPQGQQFPQSQPPQGPQRPTWNQNKNLVVLLGGAVALLLVVLLVVVIALVSKDDAPEPAAAGATTTSVPARGSTAATSSVPVGAGLTIDNRKHMSQAFFKTGATSTTLKLVIVRAAQLPGEFVPLSQDIADARSATVGLYQRATRDLVVTISGSDLDDGLAVVSRDLAVRSVPVKGASDLASDFPQALESNVNVGYFHVEAGGGESIPEVAKGIEKNQVRLWVAKGDAWDRDKAWIMMYGSSKLYETKLEWA